MPFDIVHLLFYGGQRVLYRDPAAAIGEEGVVVLGVANADDIVRRQPEALERGG
jgi:hypothetical protein